MRIVISLPEGQNVRNLLENNILKELQATFQNPEIIILTPAYNIQSFTGRWSNVKWERMFPTRMNKKQNYLSTLRRKAVRLGFNRIAGILLNRERNVLVAEGRFYEDLLLEKKDETIVLCTHIHLPFEIQIANHARKLGIPVAGIVNSWDNVFKGIQTHPDVVFVWSEQNKNDMIRLEGYPQELVITTGPPPFDVYFQQEHQWSREDFCKRVRLNPNRPILLYASIGQFVPFFEETFLLDELVKLLDDYPPDGRPQIICRLHPWSKKEIFKVYLDHPDIIFNGFENYIPTLNWCPTHEEMVFSGNLLKHANICISPGSTMVLEAAIFDTPTLVPVYNNYQPEVWEDYYSRFCLAMHFGRLVKNDFVPVARNTEQLKSWIGRYLQNPMLYHEQRKTVVKEYITHTDGQSVKRIVSGLYILWNKRKAL
ncbi:MAG: hypothetical protein JNJ65_06050 [Cyclobacteriaceae bacterium]|nr:hypothetical protein [Cyclobacteriaceae bacterium]